LDAPIWRSPKSDGPMCPHSSRSSQTAMLLQVNDINFRKCQIKRCRPRRMRFSRDLGPLKIGGP